LGVDDTSDWYQAAMAVLELNIIQGDALSMTDPSGEALVFPEWAYLGKGSFQRRDFRFDNLVQVSSFGEGTLFAGLEKHEIFAPVKSYPKMSVAEIATTFDGRQGEQAPNQTEGTN
jgi:hypothetical protein